MFALVRRYCALSVSVLSALARRADAQNLSAAWYCTSCTEALSASRSNLESTNYVQNQVLFIECGQETARDLANRTPRKSDAAI